MGGEININNLKEAYEIGLSLDLEGAAFSPRSKAFVEPYYPFLAGFVRRFGCTRIAELGTHYGGSTLAYARGIPGDARNTHLVTSDITTHENKRLAELPFVQRVQGDSLSSEVIGQFAAAFSEGVDLLYIDTCHRYWPTMENIAIYSNLLKPRFVIVDGIRLSLGMKKTWSAIRSSGAGHTLDVSEVARRSAPGFGLLECQYPFHWPESSPAHRRAMRAYFNNTAALTAKVSPTVRKALRRMVRQITL